MIRIFFAEKISSLREESLRSRARCPRAAQRAPPCGSALVGGTGKVGRWRRGRWDHPEVWKGSRIPGIGGFGAFWGGFGSYLFRVGALPSRARARKPTYARACDLQSPRRGHYLTPF